MSTFRCAECHQDEVHDGKCSAADCACADRRFHAIGTGHFADCEHRRPHDTLRVMSPHQVIEALTCTCPEVRKLSYWTGEVSYVQERDPDCQIHGSVT